MYKLYFYQFNLIQQRDTLSYRSTLYNIETEKLTSMFAYMFSYCKHFVKNHTTNCLRSGQ